VPGERGRGVLDRDRDLEHDLDPESLCLAR
jgi:hypothetical protein